ncbi:hypothetical protein A8G00_23065 [Sphingobium sp. SA916]|nr:hypothetical protein A8G00_23065 [Sphingobium sp. SA916]
MIERQQRGTTAVVTIARPAQRNALTPQSMVDLRDALVAADKDEGARVIIITGQGEQAFCAGADVRATLPSERSFISAYFDRDSDASHPLYIRNIALDRLGISKPVIAAVNGVAAGGGMEIALNCDLCIASERARFGLTEVKIGSIPAVAGIQRLLRSLPRPAAMKLLLTGDLIGADEALRLGLVSEVVPPEALIDHVLEIADRIAANAPLAVKVAKRLADKAFELPLREAAALEELMWGHLYATEDRVEGRKAFAERRPPSFRGV